MEPASILSEVPTTKSTTRNRLPESTGDNKYTEKMVPGYTGQPQYNLHLIHIAIFREITLHTHSFIIFATQGHLISFGLQRWPTIGNPVISMKNVENFIYLEELLNMHSKHDKAYKKVW